MAQWTAAQRGLAAAIEAAGFRDSKAVADGIATIANAPDDLVVAIGEVLLSHLEAETIPQQIRLSDMAKAAKAAWAETLLALAKKPERTPPERHHASHALPPSRQPQRMSPEERKALASRIARRRTLQEYLKDETDPTAWLEWRGRIRKALDLNEISRQIEGYVRSMSLSSKTAWDMYRTIRDGTLPSQIIEKHARAAFAKERLKSVI